MDSSSALTHVDSLLRTVLQYSGLELTYNLVNGSSPTSPLVTAVFAGPDVRYLLAQHAELLLALEHVAAKALRLESDEHDCISFDAGGFKAQRNRAIEREARTGADSVRASGRPYHFAPMNSRERRLLHLALAPYGLRTQSEGEGPVRHLVVHPTGAASSKDLS